MAVPEILKMLGIEERTDLADGDVLVWDAGRGKLVFQRPPVVVFADATARVAVTPNLDGQLALQLDDGSVYVASNNAWLNRSPVAAVADGTALAAAAPAFVGQLALNLATGEVSSGTDVTAGDWELVTATAAE